MSVDSALLAVRVPLEVRRVFLAMVDRRRILVRTETHEFQGHVYEVGISPFSDETTARVVDDEGRVHYFRIERATVVLP